MSITLEVTPIKSTLLYNQLKKRDGFASKKLEWIGEVPPWKVVQVEAFSEGENNLLAVFPPSHEIDFILFKEITGIHNLWRILDHEYETLETIGKDFVIYSDVALRHERKLFLWINNKNEGLALSYEDFKKLVNPNEGVFSLPLL